MYFVFDVETVLDDALARRWLQLPPDASDDETETRMAEAWPHLSIPKSPFHRVVAVAGALVAPDGSLRRLTALGSADDDEAALVAAFFRAAETPGLTLVGWNSGAFDLPVLWYRAMHHGISARRFYDIRGIRYRYGEEGHLDLMDWLSGFGASSRVSLDEMAALVGVPGKLGITGSDVAALWRAGAVEEIRRYCETDVLTTVLVLGAWAHHRGAFDADALARLHASARTFLEERRQAPTWGAYLDAWDARRSNPRG